MSAVLERRAPTHETWYARSYRVSIENLHPLIQRVLFHLKVAPDDWRVIQDEAPVEDPDDYKRVRYWRNGKVVSVPLGKYLSKHWGHTEDHIRRDWAALHTPDTFEVVNTIDGMVEAIETGPYSCMTSRYGHISYDDRDPLTHPYSAYDPAFGWHMVVRKNKDSVDGRAVCLTTSGGKVFVRSYAKPAPHSDDRNTSYTDTKLEAYLAANGYTKVDGWPNGAKLAPRRFSNGQWMLPYLDGENTRLDLEDDCFVVSRYGDYSAENTDGSVDTGRCRYDDNYDGDEDD